MALTDTFDNPQSRVEAILQNAMGAEHEVVPQSRVEELLERLDGYLENIEGKITDQDEEIIAAVNAWLEDNPEATTTVQDGSVTEAKLASALKPAVIKDYVTPEMLGVVTNGVIDVVALNTAIKTHDLIIGTGDYTISSGIVIEDDNRTVIFTGTLSHTGSGSAVIIKDCERITLCVRSIVGQDGDGIEICSPNDLTQYINVDFVNISAKKGLVISSTVGTQYVRLGGNRIYSTSNGVEIVVYDGWIGEIELQGVFVTSTTGYGIYCYGDSAGAFVTGISLFSIAITAPLGVFFRYAYLVRGVGVRFENASGTPFPVKLVGDVKNLHLVCRQLNYDDIDTTDLITTPAYNPGIKFYTNLLRNGLIIANEFEIIDSGIRVAPNDQMTAVSGGSADDYLDLSSITPRFPRSFNCTGDVYLTLPMEYSEYGINKFFVKLDGVVRIKNANGVQIFVGSKGAAGATTAAVYCVECIGGNLFGTGGWVNHVVFKV